MIDILIPVLGRPQLVEPLVENIDEATVNSYRLLFLCSTGDDEEMLAVEKVGCEFLEMDHPPAQGQYAKKINMGYHWTEGQWLFLGADDVVFHRGWDDEALKVAGVSKSVIATNDRANLQVRHGLLAVHPLVRREYIDLFGGSLDGPGSVYHEGYSHNFVDCELSVIARHRKVFAFAKRAVVHHNHPLFRRKFVKDKTYEAGLRDFNADRKIFCDRMEPIYSRDQLVKVYLRAERGVHA